MVLHLLFLPSSHELVTFVLPTSAIVNPSVVMMSILLFFSSHCYSINPLLGYVNLAYCFPPTLLLLRDGTRWLAQLFKSIHSIKVSCEAIPNPNDNQTNYRQHFHDTIDSSSGEVVPFDDVTSTSIKQCFVNHRYNFTLTESLLFLKQLVFQIGRSLS